MMPPPAELIGEKFDRLTVEALADVPRGRGRYWICRCVCGKLTGPIPTKHLRNSNSCSCGCKQKDAASNYGKRATKHTHPRKCRGCGVNFLGTHKQKFCARSCKEASKLKLDRPQECLECRVPLQSETRSGRPSVFCSDSCKSRWRNKQNTLATHGTLSEQTLAALAALEKRIGDG